MQQSKIKSKSFLGSADWADFQRSLGREVTTYDRDGAYAQVIEYETYLGKKYLYIPRGPELADGGHLPADQAIAGLVDWLRSYARQRKTLFITAEPADDSVAQALIACGFESSNKHIQPMRTVIMDLGQDIESLRSAMHPKTRYNIHVAEKSAIRIAESQDVGAFLSLLHQTSDRDQFSTHPDTYYRKLCAFFQDKAEIRVRLFFGYFDDIPVAGAMVLEHGDTAYYLHGASDHTYRKYMAPFLLHWQIMQLYKERGFALYDFWGIDANRYPGVTRFKLNWGGRVVEYPGAFVLPISKLGYNLYSLARWLKSLVKS